MTHAANPSLMPRPVVIIGAAFGDVILHVDVLPRSGDDVIAREGGRQIGGCAFNVARALARLELAPITAIPVGNGEWGQAVESEMYQEGLPVLLRDKQHDNGWCLALVEASKERTFVTIDGCEQHWTPEWLAKIPLEGQPIIYATGYELTSPLLWQWLVELSVPHTLFIDFGPRLSIMSRSQVEALLAKKPVLTLNRDELKLLTMLLAIDSSEPLYAAQQLSERYGLSLVCRLDAEGACVFEPREESTVVPVCRVTVEDTIAAGDSHCAGVIAGLACHQSLAAATRQGNEVAALVVSRPGANGAPTRSELQAFQARGT